MAALRRTAGGGRCLSLDQTEASNARHSDDPMTSDVSKKTRICGRAAGILTSFASDYQMDLAD
jgi:hypothetical protein